MPVTEMVIGISAGLFFLIGFIFLVRLIQAWMLHRSLREAISRDSDQAALLIDRIGRSDFGEPRPGAGNDDRTGLVLVALGVALAGFSLIVGEPEWLRYGIGASLFPGLVGVALLVRHSLQRRAGGPDVAAGA